MRISDWSSDVCSSDLRTSRRPSQSATKPPVVVPSAVAKLNDKAKINPACVRSIPWRRTSKGMRNRLSPKPTSSTNHQQQVRFRKAGELPSLHRTVRTCAVITLSAVPLTGLGYVHTQHQTNILLVAPVHHEDTIPTN